MEEPSPLVDLSYSIQKCSSYSSNNVPENIMVDAPSDQASRWISASHQPHQFILLKLNKTAIVKQITFGKFEKIHVCNLRKFRISGSVDGNYFVQLLDGGLANDNCYETFVLKHEIMGRCFACKFIKIEPIQTWTPSFNFSIWYVGFKGQVEQRLVRDALSWFNEYRELEVIRLCLKHFRQKNYVDAFQVLSKKTKVKLENELLTKLYDLLVVQGNFVECEKLLVDCVENGLFDEYIRRQDCLPIWKEILQPNRDLKPGMRGGHQMCIDPFGEKIYLFGGWNGKQDISDFWVYNLCTHQWTCLFADCSKAGGPSARSCHKMCMDTKRKRIFVLGRYLDATSDFYVYNCEANEWQLITDDTASMGGPKLISDHRMCMDEEKNVLYVFGGKFFSKELQENFADQLQSGLYSYHVPTNSWKLVELDEGPKGRFVNKSRCGHSMLFHQRSRNVYICGGQRNKEHLSDFFAYNVDTKEVKVICDGVTSKVPINGITRREAIDFDYNEIYFVCGMNKEKEKDENVKISFWMFNITQKTWNCCFVDEYNPADEELQRKVPKPRYAHQLVYDCVKKTFYLFGGNPGLPESPRLRLGDFWSLQLKRMTRDEILRRCKKLIRQLHFESIITSDTVNAVRYLQNELYQTFQHSNNEEAIEFQRLASLVFQCAPPSTSSSSSSLDQCDQDAQFRKRIKVYETLVNFFPDELTEPKTNLIDLIQI